MKNIRLVLFVLSSFVLSACDQDPMFWMISNEVAPKDPLINGSPSKMVKIGTDIYVANGRLWKYSNGRWARAGGPPNVYDIAAGGGGLYMLQVNDSNTSVYRMDGDKISNPTGYGMIQGLYSDGTSVFAGAMRGDSEAYAILSVDSGGLSFVRAIDSPLSGVTKSYFATAQNGILSRSGGGTVGGGSIAGIIEVDGKTIAVTGNGYILEVSGGGVTSHSTGVYSFTGALAVYQRPGGYDKLLLLGVNSGVYYMGYREMKLSDSGFTLYTPGDLYPASTVQNKDRYGATIAKRAVNSLAQVDGSALVFASTQKDGLWAYRGDEWNAEE
jgi:hypothetical protein